MLLMCRAMEVEGVGRKSGLAIVSLTIGKVVAYEGSTDFESASESDDDREVLVSARFGVPVEDYIRR